jgi:phosphoribosyl-AMP cyclohydrolase
MWFKAKQTEFSFNFESKSNVHQAVSVRVQLFQTNERASTLRKGNSSQQIIFNITPETRDCGRHLLLLFLNKSKT